MHYLDAWRVTGFLALAILHGAATVAFLGQLSQLEPPRVMLSFALAAALAFIAVGRFLVSRTGRWLGTVGICAAQVAVIAGMLAAKAWFWRAWLGFAYLVLEWLSWGVCLCRTPAAAREVDRYPGMILALAVVGWAGGGAAVRLINGMGEPLLVAMSCLSAAVGLGWFVRFRHEADGPDAPPASWPGTRALFPEMRLASWSETREGWALLIMLAALSVVIGARANSVLLIYPSLTGLSGVLVLMMVGTLPVLLGNHPYRVVGWLPYAMGCVGLVGVGQTLANGYAAQVALTVEQLACVCGVVAIFGRLLALCPPVSVVAWIALAGSVFSLFSWVGLTRGDWLVGRGYFWIGFVVLAAGCLAYWLRAWLELTAAFPAFLIYRIRHTGPGRAWTPWRGPLVVIANHAAWFDPLWLGKVIPRRLTPMMTSGFFDLPALYWLMRYILRVIRVQEAHARREAPELDEAIARLDAGECVVIFPEGWLRRDENRLLARFQRGIWYILHHRPDTPVLPCWIEGNWGSYFSWRNGPPMKNKPFDWCRRITIVIGEPHRLSDEILSDHRVTRQFLAQKVLELRKLLGLPEPAATDTDSPLASCANSQPGPDPSQSHSGTPDHAGQ